MMGEASSDSPIIIIIFVCRGLVSGSFVFGPSVVRFGVVFGLASFMVVSFFDHSYIWHRALLS